MSQAAETIWEEKRVTNQKEQQLTSHYFGCTTEEWRKGTESLGSCLCIIVTEFPLICLPTAALSLPCRIQFPTRCLNSFLQLSCLGFDSTKQSVKEVRSGSFSLMLYRALEGGGCATGHPSHHPNPCASFYSRSLYSSVPITLTFRIVVFIIAVQCGTGAHLLGYRHALLLV